MSDKPALPGATMHNPDCGACYAELEYDDGLICTGCRLAYSTSDPERPAWFMDDEDKPCGHPGAPTYEKYMHRQDTYGTPVPGGLWRFSEDPCSLPAGHTSGHWHQHNAERLTTDYPKDPSE